MVLVVCFRKIYVVWIYKVIVGLKSKMIYVLYRWLIFFVCFSFLDLCNSLVNFVVVNGVKSMDVVIFINIIKGMWCIKFYVCIGMFF